MVLTGTVHINVHFYEDGNVQLNASHELEAKAKSGNTADQTAAAVLKVHESIRVWWWWWSRLGIDSCELFSCFRRLGRPSRSTRRRWRVRMPRWTRRRSRRCVASCQ